MTSSGSDIPGIVAGVHGRLGYQKQTKVPSGQSERHKYGTLRAFRACAPGGRFLTRLRGPAIMAAWPRNPMKYRKLGRTGLEVSEIGFGAWAIGGSWGPQSEADSVAALNRALDLGVNFIDTAAGYGDGRSERIIAEVLKERRGSRRRRHEDAPDCRGPGRPSPYCVGLRALSGEVPARERRAAPAQPRDRPA